jgi:hypothetical protein
MSVANDAVDILLKPMIVEDVVVEVPDVPSKVLPTQRVSVDEDPVLVIKLKWS